MSPRLTLLYIHGAPGSRHEFYPDESELVKRGIRLVTVDRPGYGLTTQDHRRTYLAFVADLRELLASLDPPARRVSVMGFSSGAPYAHACARLFPPGTISSVSIVSGDGPNRAYDDAMRERVCGFTPDGRLGLQLLRLGGRRALYWGVRLAASLDALKYAWNPDAFVQRSFGKRLCSVPDVYQMLLHDWHTAHAESDVGDAVATDVLLEQTPWGWSLADLNYTSMPRYHVWHGLSDKVIPTEVAEYVHKALPEGMSTLHLLPKTGHPLHFRADHIGPLLDAVVTEHDKAMGGKASIAAL